MNEESGAIADRATQQREFLQNLKAAGLENELNATLEAFELGTYDDAIATLKQLEHEATAAFQGEMLQSAVEALAPQLRRLLNDPNVGYDETFDMADAVDGLLQSINLDALDENGKEQYNALKTLLDGMKTLMLWQQNKGAMPRPTFDANGNPLPAYTSPPKLTQYYDPMAYEGKGWVNKDLVFSGADITISNPRMKYQSLIGGFAVGGGESFGGTSNVNVEVETSDVALNIDGRAIASAVIKYLPKVQAQIGKPVYSYGGGFGKVMELER